MLTVDLNRSTRLSQESPDRFGVRRALPRHELDGDSLRQ
jgi:hypothetical protein